ncbi:MAG: hypothetical protein CTY16_12755 [Methylobacter sp.]|nr:MAG: hypothetical protein CTY16_12755 [Methylobacter sp.]
MKKNNLTKEAIDLTTSSQRLHELAQNKIVDSIRINVARNPNTHLETLRELAFDKKADVRAAVANNPSAPSILLDGLANDISIRVRAAVSGSLNTSTKTLHELAQNERVGSIRINVARNPNTDLETLRKLTFDKIADVRAAVADNLNVPPDLLDILANDKSISVRVAVSESSNTSNKTLTRLAQSSSQNICDAVLKNSNTPREVISVLNAKNPKTSARLLGLLSKDKNESVRVNVARNEHCPLIAFSNLVKDDVEMIRVSVAHNNTLPTDLLIQLSTDKSALVRLAVAKNKNCPVIALRNLANDETEKVRIAIACHSSSPDDLLIQLASDKSKLVCLEIAKRQDCPESALIKLATDDTVSVRLAIFHNAKTPSNLFDNNASSTSANSGAYPKNLHSYADQHTNNSKDAQKYFLDAISSYDPLLFKLLRKIDALELTALTINRLENNNILYIGDLIQYTEDELSKVKYLGKKSLIEVKDALYFEGLSLGIKLKNERWIYKQIGGNFEELFTQSIEDLGLCKISENYLKTNNILLIEDLIQYTEAELLKILNFRKKSFYEVKDMLQCKGLSLGILPKKIIDTPLTTALAKFIAHHPKITNTDKPLAILPTQLRSGGPAIPAPPEPESGLQLDMNRVAALKNESKKVTDMLVALFEQTVDTELVMSPQANEFTTDQNDQLLGLDNDYSTLIKLLCSRAQWTRAELEEIAADSGMMLDGILEHINEAAYDHFDMPFTEGGDPIDINQDILKELMK